MTSDKSVVLTSFEEQPQKTWFSPCGRSSGHVYEEAFDFLQGLLLIVDAESRSLICRFRQPQIGESGSVIASTRS